MVKKNLAENSDYSLKKKLAAPVPLKKKSASEKNRLQFNQNSKKSRHQINKKGGFSSKMNSKKCWLQFGNELQKCGSGLVTLEGKLWLYVHLLAEF